MSDCQHTRLAWHCHTSCLLFSRSACHTEPWTPLGHRGAPSGRAGPPPHWQGLPQTPCAGHRTPAHTHLRVTLPPSAFQPAMPLEINLKLAKTQNHIQTQTRTHACRDRQTDRHTHACTLARCTSACRPGQTQASWLELDRLATRQLFRGAWSV